VAKTHIPSTAQAKLIARLWAGFPHFYTLHSSYVDPTAGACIKHGWLVETGEAGKTPNGTDFKIYEPRDAGLDALASYLLAERYKRKSQASPTAQAESA